VNPKEDTHHPRDVFTDAELERRQNIFEDQPLGVWMAWRAFMGHEWSPGSKTVGEVFAELAELRRENPDEWAAFMAARRIEGKEV